MSDTDSFIEEVSEEVRRDRLYKVLRKYAWVGILAVVTIVGGTAYLEFQKAQARTEAEAVGTCLLYTSPSPRDLSTSRMPSSA